MNNISELSKKYYEINDEIQMLIEIKKKIIEELYENSVKLVSESLLDILVFDEENQHYNVIKDSILKCLKLSGPYKYKNENSKCKNGVSKWDGLHNTCECGKTKLKWSLKYPDNIQYEIVSFE